MDILKAPVRLPYGNQSPYYYRKNDCFTSGPRALALLLSNRYCFKPGATANYRPVPWHSCLPARFRPSSCCSYIGGRTCRLLLVQAARLARKVRFGPWSRNLTEICWIVGKSRELLEKTETGKPLARSDAALLKVAFSAVAEATRVVAGVTLWVTVAVVLPLRALSCTTCTTCTTCASTFCTAFTAVFPASFFLVSVFRFLPSTSTTAALSSSLAAVIQFSSLVVVTPCRSSCSRSGDASVSRCRSPVSSLRSSSPSFRSSFDLLLMNHLMNRVMSYSTYRPAT